jgi:hypothetical protein
MLLSAFVRGRLVSGKKTTVVFMEPLGKKENVG